MRILKISICSNVTNTFSFPSVKGNLIKFRQFCLREGRLSRNTVRNGREGKPIVEWLYISADRYNRAPRIFALNRFQVKPKTCCFMLLSYTRGIDCGSIVTNTVRTCISLWCNDIIMKRRSKYITSNLRYCSF